MKHYINDFQSFVVNDAIKTYESYLQKNYKIEIINALIESNTLKPEVQFLLESIAESNLYTDLWEGTVSEQFINENLNEGTLVDWFAEKKKKAVETIKDIAAAGADKITAAKKVIIDKAKQTVEMFKSFGDWVGKILNAIKVGLQKLWKAVYGSIEKKFNGKESPVAKGVAHKMEGKGEEFGGEVKQLGNMSGGGIKWVTGGAIEKIGAAVKDAGKAKVDESESILNFYEVVIHEAVLQCVKTHGMVFINEAQDFESLLESEDAVKIPGLSKLVHAMHELPIIKQLGDIEHGAAKIANTGLEKLSYVLNKVGAAGGPYKFTLVGAAVGLGVEYYVKTKIKSKLGLDHESESMDSFDADLNEGEGKTLKQYLIAAGVSGAILAICIIVPGFAVVFGIMKKVATVVWWYSVFQVVVGLLKSPKKSDKDLEEDIEKQKEEDKKKTEELVDTAKEDAEDDLKKGGEGLDDDEEDKDKK